MTATYTFDVFSSLDGFGSVSGGDWGGYWGEQGPELLQRRLELYEVEQRMVFGANAHQLFARMMAEAANEAFGTRGSPGCETCRRRWCRTP